MGNIFGRSSAAVPVAFEFTGEVTSDEPVYKEVEEIIREAPNILARLESFKGCGEFIREAITNPSPMNEEAAWKAVVPSVEILKGLFEYSVMIEKTAEKLIIAANSASNKPDEEGKTTTLAYAYLLSKIFDFVIHFDDLKMINPAIQNDFSYYRRILNRIKLTNKAAAGVTVNDELANHMSLFYAYPTPMMNCLTKTASNLILQSDAGVTIDSLCKYLANLGNSCGYLVHIQKVTDQEECMRFLRTATGCIILFEHISVKGAFHKKSPFKMRTLITTIKDYNSNQNTETLVNSLRFNTPHLNDPSTPPQIKSLLL